MRGGGAGVGWVVSVCVYECVGGCGCGCVGVWCVGVWVCVRVCVIDEYKQIYKCMFVYE